MCNSFNNFKINSYHLQEIYLCEDKRAATCITMIALVSHVNLNVELINKVQGKGRTLQRKMDIYRSGENYMLKSSRDLANESSHIIKHKYQRQN